MTLEFRNILVKKSGWKEFVSPVHKKLMPVVFPAIAIGYVFFNIAIFFVDKGIMGELHSRLFMTAVVFLYLWLLLQLFMLSCWVYTYLATIGKIEPSAGQLKRY